MAGLEKMWTMMYWFLVIFGIYIIYELTRKLLGGSLTYESLIIAGVVANIGFSVQLTKSIGKLDAKLSEHIGWHKGRED